MKKNKFLIKFAFFQAVDPEIDSTTDLLPTEASSSSSGSSSSSSTTSTSSSFPCAAETLTIQQTQDQSDDKLVSICQKRSQLTTNNLQPQITSPVAATSSACSIINFPTTPDLITLFDEEMNKNSTDMCQYSELFPYNNVITQALLNCNEVNTLCEQGTSNDLGNNITDLTFLSSVNQTAIDNLKALTNLQNHSTNFLSSITLPKSNYNEIVSDLFPSHL